MKIEFAISTYKNPHHVATMLGCLCAQTNPNWKAHVITETIYDGYYRIKNFYSDHPQIKFTELNGPFNDWGHSQRLYGMMQASEEWVVMTGDDNYYCPIFVDQLLSVVNSDTNFVYTDMLHNHHNYLEYFVSEPEVNRIDIGNFATRSSLAKVVPFNKSLHNGDGFYVVEYIRRYCNLPGSVKKISKALYVHN